MCFHRTLKSTCPRQMQTVRRVSRRLLGFKCVFRVLYLPGGARWLVCTFDGCLQIFWAAGLRVISTFPLWLAPPGGVNWGLEGDPSYPPLTRGSNIHPVPKSTVNRSSQDQKSIILPHRINRIKPLRKCVPYCTKNEVRHALNWLGDGI